jgi:adenylylsulfate kinase
MAHSQGFTLWLTGMSGTGKTTLATYIAARLRQVGRPVEVLDEGDLGATLWAESAGDTKEERNTVVRRLGFLAGMLTRNGVAALVPAVSPYKGSRDENRRAIGKYVEVFVDCPTEKLIERDTTGRYKRALGGELPNFIGITEPYEPPSSPEVTLRSDRESTEEGAMRIFQALLDLGFMTSEELKVITGKKMKANPVPKKQGDKQADKPDRVEKPVAEKGAEKQGGARAAKPARATPAAPAAKEAKEATGKKARPAARAAREVKPAKKAAPAAKRKAR